MLTTDAHERPYVPPGCAHGFLVLSDIADFHYKVTTPYNPQSECALRWDDSVLAIDWPLEIGIELILSAKDRSAPGFKECVKSEWPRKNYPLTNCLAGGEHQTHQIGDDLRLRTSVQLVVVGKTYGRLRGLR